ncbi:MAG: TIGR02453 family protein, partial [Thermoanaerobaculia bacterium]
FRHKQGKDVHAPGFYLHLEPDQCFAGVGIYHPDGPALAKIRQALVDDPASWKRVRDGKRLREHFEQGGEALKRAPKGYDPDHPLIEDLKRKDFIAFAKLSQKQITAPDFLDSYAEMCQAGSGYIEFLCEAVGVPF